MESAIAVFRGAYINAKITKEGSNDLGIETIVRSKKSKAVKRYWMRKRNESHYLILAIL